jgi:hypothetical protein
MTTPEDPQGRPWKVWSEKYKKITRLRARVSQEILEKASSVDLCKGRDSFAKTVLLGGIREREIPDPIPNSEVKPLIADGTAHKSAGE